MAIYLTAFPTLNRDLKVKIGYFATRYSFTYKRNGSFYELDSQSTTETSTSTSINTLKIIDKNAVWHPEHYDLIINMKCTLNSPGFLFGSKGIVPTNATLGIGIQWTAKEASVRGFFSVAEITANDRGPLNIEDNLHFPPKSLRGTLTLKTVLYVKKSGKAEASESHLANKSGIILGTLEETRVLIDGNGSVFPIVETNSPGEPLWWVDCNWNDPREDIFAEENFCVHLNTAHKDYSSLNENEGLKNSPLLAEIIASSIQILITNVMTDASVASDTRNGRGLEPGSVSSVVNYLINSFNLDMNNNPEKMAISIRKDLMQRM